MFGLFEHGADALGAEAVDRVVVERVHAGEPHEVHVLAGGRRDLAARVDAAGVAEQDDLRHHRGVVGRSAAARVGGLQHRAVHAIDDRVHHAHEGALGDELFDGGREEHGLMLHAGLERWSAFCSPQCKNQYNVYKSRGKKNCEENRGEATWQTPKKINCKSATAP